MKLCKGTCDQWDARAAGHWDTAVKTSSCLRAALARALRVEAAVAKNFEATGILWDVSAFFDFIELADLVEFGLDMDFPPWELNLSLQVHAGARAFKEGPYISEFVQPSGKSNPCWMWAVHPVYKMHYLRYPFRRAPEVSTCASPNFR